MTEHNDEPQAGPQMVYRISQAAEYVVTEAIAGNPDHEQVIRSFVEDQFDRHPRVGAAEHSRKWAVFRRSLLASQQTEIAGIDVNDASYAAAVGCQTFKQTGKCAIAIIETGHSGVGMRWTRPDRRMRIPIPVGDLHRCHDQAGACCTFGTRLLSPRRHDARGASKTIGHVNLIALAKRPYEIQQLLVGDLKHTKDPRRTKNETVLNKQGRFV